MNSTASSGTLRAARAVSSPLGGTLARRVFCNANRGKAADAVTTDVEPPVSADPVSASLRSSRQPGDSYLIGSGRHWLGDAPDGFGRLGDGERGQGRSWSHEHASGPSVQTTVHLQELHRDFAAYDAVYRSYFRPPFPVRTTVGSGLMNILVEIDLVAYLGS